MLKTVVLLSILVGTVLLFSEFFNKWKVQKSIYFEIEIILP